LVATFTLTNSTVSNNRTGAEGGGLDLFVHTATITTSTLTGNRAVTGGGGVAFLTDFSVGGGGQLLTVTQSNISNNRAGGSGSGGGIWADGDGSSTVNLVNDTLFGNTAGLNGGALAVDRGTANVLFLTIDGNLANFGGGIFSGAGLATNLGNTIVAQNTATTTADGLDLFGTTFSDTLGTIGATLVGAVGHNFISSGVGFTGLSTASPFADFIGGMNIAQGLSAKLAPLASNGGPTQTQARLSGSLALNHALFDVAVATVAPTDQRGVARPQGPGADIGAFESGLSS
jgi:hypothetical protein